MKIFETVKKEVTIEKEINLPYFFKEGSSYFKIASEEHAFKLETSDNYLAVIASSTYLYARNAATGVEITEEEFDAAYMDVQEKIKARFEQTLKAVEVA